MSADGDKIYSGSWDGTIKIWDISSGLCLQTLNGHKDAITCVIVDGDYIYSSSVDRTVRVWLLKTGAEVLKLEKHTASVNHIVIIGERLFSCSADSSIIAWDKKTGDHKDTFLGHTDTVRYLANINGELFSSGDDEKILKWHPYKGEVEQTLKGSVFAYGVAITENYIYYGSRETLNILDRRTGVVKEFQTEHTIYWCCYNKAKDELYLGTEGGFLRIWRLRGTKAIQSFRGHKAGVLCIRLDGDLLYSGSEDRTLKVWDTRTFKLVGELTAKNIHPISCIDVVIDRIFAGTKEKKVYVWDKKNNALMYTWSAHTGAVTGIRVFGGCVYTCGDDGLKQWTGSGKLLNSFPTMYIVKMFVHLASHRIYTIDYNLMVTVHNFKVKKKRKT